MCRNLFDCKEMQRTLKSLSGPPDGYQRTGKEACQRPVRALNPTPSQGFMATMTPGGASGSRTASSAAAIGFLTVAEHEPHGWFGGLLLLNVAGRPLEFHCTAPLKANRAQEILFGPTLRPYLFGEQIGRTLIAQIQRELLAVFTDCEPVLAARELVEVPVALVHSPVDDSGKLTQLRFDAPQATPPRPGQFRIGRNLLTASAGFPGDESLVAGRLAGVGDRLDLFEPFGRIREAIEEAQRSGK